METQNSKVFDPQIVILGLRGRFHIFSKYSVTEDEVLVWILRLRNWALLVHLLSIQHKYFFFILFTLTMEEMCYGIKGPARPEWSHRLTQSEKPVFSHSLAAIYIIDFLFCNFGAGFKKEQAQ